MTNPFCKGCGTLVVQPSGTCPKCNEYNYKKKHENRTRLNELLRALKDSANLKMEHGWTTDKAGFGEDDIISVEMGKGRTVIVKTHTSTTTIPISKYNYKETREILKFLERREEADIVCRIGKKY